MCARVYLCYASAGMLASACKSVCVCLPVGECMSLCVYSVGPWSLSVDLNQPSPVLFAQDMPQEAKTTARVCPGLRTSLNTPDSCILRQRRHCVYQCFYTFILWNLLDRGILADLFWRNTHQEEPRGLRCQPINHMACCNSDKQILCASYIIENFPVPESAVSQVLIWKKKSTVAVMNAVSRKSRWWIYFDGWFSVLTDLTEVDRNTQRRVDLSCPQLVKTGTVWPVKMPQNHPDPLSFTLSFP